MKITGKEILDLGFDQGQAIGMILAIIEHQSEGTKEELFQTLKSLLEDPKEFLEDSTWKEVAEKLLHQPEKTHLDLREESLDYTIYGEENIEGGALAQMETAMKLPVATGGSLMPDAHQGYGLPIGGVLATQNAIIPYAVGVDIGCRMCLSIYDFPEETLDIRKMDLKKMLLRNTMFGRESFKRPRDHEILHNPLFDEVSILKSVKDRARKQIGSSGGGNHFVEFGTVEILDENNEWNIKPGKYMALLSHSGSRGMGATIANHYTKLAMAACPLPQQAKHLAWLDLDTELGMEYWLAMNLAGDYASACHEQIHQRMAIGLRTTPLAIIENHHNFAWKEKDENDQDIIVHRKGATPAGKGVLGIIPGSMTAPGFIVRGKGNATSINSASHGAGRQMSRTKAKNELQKDTVEKYLMDHGVDLIGGGLDEAPMAYKDINQVMSYQHDLVEVIGTFLPKIVRMCGDKKFRAVD